MAPVIKVADPATGELVTLPGLPALPGATPLGLDLPPSLTWDQWDAYGGVLQQAQRSILWLLGDWMRYGADRWPDRYEQAVDATGYAVRTARNAAWVAGSVEPSRRREKAPWWQHAEVAGLGPAAQDEMLDWCEAEDPRRDDLRAEIERRGLRQPRTVLPRGTVGEPPHPDSISAMEASLSADLSRWLADGRALAARVRRGVPFTVHSTEQDTFDELVELLQVLDRAACDDARRAAA